MLSESTARLVAEAVVLDEPESVHIKGADLPVPARRLLGVSEQGAIGRRDSTLVGRQWELAALPACWTDRPPARGRRRSGRAAGCRKSRLVAEFAAIAAGRGVSVFSTFCESHATEIRSTPISRLLRAPSGWTSSPTRRREQIRARVPDAEAEDLLLLDDLLGIRDPTVPSPDIAPDARRRRLTALVNGGVAGPLDAGCVRHRGCALDRSGQ